MTKNTKRKLKGFSIAETLIATSVLVIGLLALLILVANTMKNSIDSRDQILATALSQEGVEIVRNFRDTNLIQNGNDGLKAFNAFPAGNEAKCQADMSALNPGSMTCNAGQNYSLKYANGFYVHSAGTATKFKRRIGITYCASNDGILNNPSGATKVVVTSTVTWNDSAPPGYTNTNGTCSGWKITGTGCSAANKCITTQDTIGACNASSGTNC